MSTTLPVMSPRSSFCVALTVSRPPCFGTTVDSNPWCIVMR
jgi:hypothetical protein